MTDASVRQGLSDAGSRADPGVEPQIVILGAGMSGICMAIELRRAGIDSFVVLEKTDGVGGTWWDNRYPGAQCDVPSHLYSFSFERHPGWSRVFAPSDEIQRYVAHCVARYDLARHLRLGTELVAAEWDAAAARWRLTTRGGRVLRPRFFLLSLGPLNHPRLPDGIDAFRGAVMHTARWHGDYEFRGKRVAVIGSAASAVQVVPALADQAARLTIFQRTPSWIVDRPDREYGPVARALFRVGTIGWIYRTWLYWRFEANYAAFKGRGLMYRLLTRMAASHLERQVPDPALREKLRPRYPIGCKRILISSDFYPTLARSNVELVPQAAAGFAPHGVIAADGSMREFDAIVCATGFETIDPLAHLPVRGTGGRTLADAWRDGPEAYHGITVAGFPNLFMLLGPNTGTGHTSVLIPIEAQARYIRACLAEIARRGARSMDVRADAMARHSAQLQRRLAQTVWASPACTSWYKTRAGRVIATYPGFISRYVLETWWPRFGDYRFEPATGRAD